MKKTLLILGIVSILSMQACTTEDTPIINEPTPDTVTIDNEETNVFTSREGVSFEYPLGWQIVTFGRGLEFNESHENYLNETLSTNTSLLRSVFINFDSAIDFGEYEANIDVPIYDFVLESPMSVSTYLNKTLPGGETSEYENNNGINFTIWKGQNPTYDSSLVTYVTTYIDQDNQTHIVEISRTGGVYSELIDNLAPIIDSMDINEL